MSTVGYILFLCVGFENIINIFLLQQIIRHYLLLMLLESCMGKYSSGTSILYIVKPVLMDSVK